MICLCYGLVLYCVALDVFLHVKLNEKCEFLEKQQERQDKPRRWDCMEYTLLLHIVKILLSCLCLYCSTFLHFTS